MIPLIGEEVTVTITGIVTGIEKWSSGIKVKIEDERKKVFVVIDETLITEEDFKNAR